MILAIPHTGTKKEETVAVTPEYIYVEMVEAIIKEDNGLELRWLKSLLNSGIRIMGTKGRYLKSQRFLDRLEKDGNKEEEIKGTPNKEAGVQTKYRAPVSGWDTASFQAGSPLAGGI